MSFLFNLFAHFKTKDELIGNLEKWCNYYRKHVTDTLSGYSGNVLVAAVYLQRAGLGTNIRQEYTDHTLEEIENSNIKEYYYLRYEIFDTHIVFYDNGMYPRMPGITLHFK
jgi:Zn/Cd-binding protein ZinT